MSSYYNCGNMELINYVCDRLLHNIFKRTRPACNLRNDVATSFFCAMEHFIHYILHKSIA